MPKRLALALALSLALAPAAPLAAQEPPPRPAPVDATVAGTVSAREVRLEEPGGAVRVVLFIRRGGAAGPALPVHCRPHLALECAALPLGEPARVVVRFARSGPHEVRLLALRVSPDP